MANSSQQQQQQISIKPWILEAVPFVVVVLIAAHVLALVCTSITLIDLSFFGCYFFLLILEWKLGLLDIQSSYRKASWTKKEALEL